MLICEQLFWNLVHKSSHICFILMSGLLWPHIVVLLILTDDSVKTQDIEADSVGCQESDETSTLEDVCSKNYPL